MSELAGLLEAQPLEAPILPKYEPRTGFGEVFDAAYEMQRETLNSDARTRIMRQQQAKAFDVYRSTVGDLPTITKRGRQSVDIDAYNARVAELKEQAPEQYKDLQTTNDITQAGIRRAQEATARFQDIAGRAGGLTQVTAPLAAGVGASFTDPVNLAVTAATLPFGGPIATTGKAAGQSVGKYIAGNLFAKDVLKVAGREALINAGAEGLLFGAVRDWQEEIGNEYGLSDLLQNMATGAVFGASVPIVLRGAKVSKDLIYSKMSEAPLPQEAKAAAQYLARSEHLAEGTPQQAPTPQQRSNHVKSLQIATEAFEEGRPLTQAEIEAIPSVTKIPEIDLGGVDVGVRFSDESLELVRTGVRRPASRDLPTRLTQFIIDQGGIVDDGAEVSSIIGNARARPGLINNRTGRSFDELGEVATEAGFFETRPDKQEFFDALDRDFNFGEVFAGNDPRQQTLRDFRDRSTVAEETGRFLEDVGLDYNSLSNDQIRAAVARLQDAEDVAREFEALEAEGFTGRPITETVLPDDVTDALIEQGIIEAPLLPIEQANALIKASNTPEVDSALSADFQRLLDQDESMQISMEAESFTVKALNEQFLESETFVREVSNCGLG